MALIFANHGFLEEGYDSGHKEEGIPLIQEIGFFIVHNLIDTDRVGAIISGYGNRSMEFAGFLKTIPECIGAVEGYDLILGGLESYTNKKNERVALLGENTVLERKCRRWVDRDKRFFNVWKYFKYEIIKNPDYCGAVDIVCCCTRQILLAAGVETVYPFSVFKADMRNQKLVCFMENGRYLENAQKLMAK